MGMTYEELSMYGRLRKIFRCGPVSMFQVLSYTSLDTLDILWLFSCYIFTMTFIRITKIPVSTAPEILTDGCEI
jgi:hypothetical protein